tara:strand:+ start:1778 stop:1996 length:219 start_codon:yes stop_codon:yes gene_type:complete
MTTKYLAVVRFSKGYDSFDTILIDMFDTRAIAEMVIEAFKANLNKWDKKLYSNFQIIEKHKGSVAILQSFEY